jgi:hypothetical protein
MFFNSDILTNCSNLVIVVSKKQTLAIFAVVFATAMIVGSIAAASDNMAFATNKKTKQKMAQNTANSQSTTCSANGGPAFGTGTGLVAGVGAGISANIPGLNICPNFNTNNNVATGNQAATTG